jgi:hypothetical protein
MAQRSCLGSPYYCVETSFCFPTTYLAGRIPHEVMTLSITVGGQTLLRKLPCKNPGLWEYLHQPYFLVQRSCSIWVGAATSLSHLCMFTFQCKFIHTLDNK